jgi:two-component system nitrate/nitrite response regulator NarL
MKHPIRIMLVEDSPEYRKTITLAVQKESDMELIGQFGTAEEAQSSLQDPSTHTVPDIILLDLNLPGMTGIAATPWFAQNLPDTKIIVLTQSNQEPDVLNAISAGANGYLLKGSTRRQIFEAIRNVMAGGLTIDPEVASYILKTLHTGPAPTDSQKNLSEREKEILTLLAEGMPQKEISNHLELSDSTVSTYIRRIYKKLKVQNVAAAIHKAHKAGLFSGK